MDDMTSNNMEGASGRSEAEMAWDAEFANMEEPSGGGLTGTLDGVAKLLIKLPAALVQLPMAILPEDTQKHARAALLESFLAVRSLLSAVGDGIEGALSDSGQKKATYKGPQGTWGAGRYSGSSRPPGKVQRIEVQDEVSEAGGGDGSGTRITIDDLADSNEEGRGLRADIDY